MNSRTIYLVYGPTAIGKTEKAIDIAKSLSCPIVSCDSRQIYKELNIGVAKPSLLELSEAEHFFISHISIHDKYSAGQFAFEARNLMNELFKKHENIVVCGGTGFYLKSLINGIDNMPEENEELRLKLKSEMENFGIKFLQDKLLKLNPHKHNSMDISNPQRLIRAIEIEENSNNNLKSESLPKWNFNIKLEKIYLKMEREKLYEKINLRVEKMINMGLEEEVKNLLNYKELNALNTVGYKEWWDYFENKTTLEKVIEKIKQNTRNYAKRQITWFANQVLESA